MHILTAFREKSSTGEHWSMTRTVAFMFAIAFVAAMETYAFRGKEINMAFAVLGCVTLLAVPLQGLFTFLGQWIASREGRDLLTTAIHKIEENLMGKAPTPQVNVSANSDGASASVGATPEAKG